MNQLLIALAVALLAQPALKFEVATIKPTDPGKENGMIRPAPGGERYLATNIPLRLYIIVAYRLKDSQVIGGPSWLDTERYDMNAKAEKPSSVEDLHLMLQDLLAERFKLKFHKESKELPMYALTVDQGSAKSGTKLQPHQADSAGDPWIDQAFDQLKSKWHATSTPMDYFAWRLSLLLDRPVVDLTKLKGGYDFDLSFTRELPPGLQEGALLNGVPADTSGPTIYEALRQQLGLKLEKQKGPVEIMVIDHAEKPEGN